MKRMTLKQHRGLGLRISSHRQQMIGIYLDVARRSGKTSDGAKALADYIAKLGDTLSQMEDIMFREYPERPTQTLLGIYYRERLGPLDIE